LLFRRPGTIPSIGGKGRHPLVGGCGVSLSITATGANRHGVSQIETPPSPRFASRAEPARLLSFACPAGQLARKPFG